MHASIQATLYNAHFDTKGVPWTAEDLLGRGNRDERNKERLNDQLVSRKVSFMADKGSESELPDWAKELAANRKLVN